MTIEIAYDDSGMAEACCFCTEPTHFWNPAVNIALCPACSATRKKEDIPSRGQWMEEQRQRAAKARRDAGLPPLTEYRDKRYPMSADEEDILNGLLPAGWSASFVPAEDESVDDEFAIGETGSAWPRFSLQRLSCGGGYSLNEFIRADDGSILKILSYPEIDTELRDAARRIAGAIDRTVQT